MPQPGLLLARQHACLMLIRGRMTGEGSIFKVLSLWPGPNVMHRRTERFRSDSLRRHGYSVTDATYSQVHSQSFTSPCFQHHLGNHLIQNVPGYETFNFNQGRRPLSGKHLPRVSDLPFKVALGMRLAYPSEPLSGDL